MVDLPLLINLSEQIPALRRVRALDQLLMLDLPPLAAGVTLAGELRLCDGDGEILDESGGVGFTPLIQISYFGDDGQVTLALVTDFTPVGDDPDGWAFNLELLAQALFDYLGTDGESKEAIFEASLASAGNVRLLYRRAVTLLAPVANGSSPAPVSVPTSPVLRSDITDAAALKAVVTVGAALPVVYLTLEAGSWVAWTLRARTVDDDPVTYPDSFRVPDDFDADTNNVIWVHSAFA
jgi:hypothetical protein